MTGHKLEFTGDPELVDLFTEQTHTQRIAGEVKRAVDLHDYRHALADALAHIEAGTVPPADRLRAMRVLAGIPAHDAGATPEQRRDDGIARAAAKWTPAEVMRVDAAIERAAAYASADISVDGGTFTTADVWAELGPEFPVTKGIAGRMAAARAAGLIESTGRTIIAPRSAKGPNHGQRLTVWRAL